MNILVFLLIGIIAGWIAGHLVDGRGLGLIGDMIVGVIGAFVGGVVFGFFGFAANGFIAQVSMASIGAIIFLFVVALFTGRRTNLKS